MRRSLSFNASIAMPLFDKFVFALSRFGTHFQCRLTKLIEQGAMIGIDGVTANASFASERRNREAILGFL